MRPPAFQRSRAGDTPLTPEPAGGRSATPIYDALCSEWRSGFKTLPGDRSGEEDLGFTAFGLGPYGSYGSSSYGSDGYQPRHGAPQHATGHLATLPAVSDRSRTGGAQDGRPEQRQDHSAGRAAPVWQPIARLHTSGMHHVPAALPPGPRRGL
ncbi:hypothetical protein ACFY93_02975 [Streptomyces sp. NPDC008313]|uniref:hypothetical protein n=1 Tax=Streptomyces sp. NPDC008313 TaxID=3364826 RepID=UPI0036E981D6